MYVWGQYDVGSRVECPLSLAFMSVVVVMENQVCTAYVCVEEAKLIHLVGYECVRIVDPYLMGSIGWICGEYFVQ